MLKPSINILKHNLNALEYACEQYKILKIYRDLTSRDMAYQITDNKTQYTIHKILDDNAEEYSHSIYYRTHYPDFCLYFDFIDFLNDVRFNDEEVIYTNLDFNMLKDFYLNHIYNDYFNKVNRPNSGQSKIKDIIKNFDKSDFDSFLIDRSKMKLYGDDYSLNIYLIKSSLLANYICLNSIHIQYELDMLSNNQYKGIYFYIKELPELKKDYSNLNDSILVNDIMSNDIKKFFEDFKLKYKDRADINLINFNHQKEIFNKEFEKIITNYIGDDLICINIPKEKYNGYDGKNKKIEDNELTLYKKYKSIQNNFISFLRHQVKFKMVCIINDKNEEILVEYKNFITLKKWRNQCINNIINQ